MPAASPPKRRRRWRSALGAGLVAYMAGIFALSHTPRPPLPEVLSELSDDTLHAAEYVPLGFLWSAVLGSSPLSGAVLGWAAATGFGVTDELHQSRIPGRDASLDDLLADSAGAALGALTAFLLRTRRPLLAAR